MTTDLVARVPSNPVPAAYTPDWVNLVKRTVADGATPDEFAMFLYQCQKTGLDPLAKQIYLQRRWNQKKNRHDIAIITGIDGYRLTAQRTGEYAGSDDAVFDDEERPRKATVTVYRIVKGVRCAFTASARWDQYFPGDALGFMWKKMPHLMLGKCAEALALRKAFPQELSGVYVKEEMDQAGEIIEATPLPPKPAPAPKPLPGHETLEIPFGSSPPQEIYTAKDHQKRLLQKSAGALGITERSALVEISEALTGRGVAVDDLDRYVTALVYAGRLGVDEKSRDKLLKAIHDVHIDSLEAFVKDWWEDHRPEEGKE